MRLQVAFDFLGLSDTLRVAEEIHELVDVVEVGTLLLWREGIETLREMKHRLPGAYLLVDSKIVDAGGDSAGFFFDAGADAVTVLGSATGTTIEATVAEGRRRDGYVVGDTIGWVDAVSTARFLKDCGVDEICVNASTDQVPSPSSYAELSTVREAVPGMRLSVSGRINTDVIPTIVQYHPETLIVGRAVTQSVSPRKAVEELRAAIAVAEGA